MATHEISIHLLDSRYRGRRRNEILDFFLAKQMKKFLLIYILLFLFFYLYITTFYILYIYIHILYMYIVCK